MISCRKLTLLGLCSIIASSILVACSPKPAEQKATSYVPTELKVQFVPSQDAETLETRAKPLEKLLGDKLGIPVKVNVAINYTAIVEGMSSKQIDVAFLAPTTYILAKDRGAAEVLVQAQRYGVNEKNGEPSSDLVDFYRSMIIVRTDSNIKSIQDLKGKKMAWQDVSSTAGYIYPAAELKKSGIDPEKDIQGITVKGYDKAAAALYNKEVDAAAVFEDIRTNVKRDYPDIFDKTRIIVRTDKIPNDTISVRPDMDSSWKDKIANAFIEIGNDPEGKKVIKDVYKHIGYVRAKDENFNIVRQYKEAVSK